MGNWNTSEDLLVNLMSARSTKKVEEIISSLPVISPDEYQWDYHNKIGEWKKGSLHWIPVGLERGNGGRIKLAGEPMNPLAERLVNGMEALLEEQRLIEIKNNPTSQVPQNPREAVMRYFGLPALDAVEKQPEAEQKLIKEKIREIRKKLSIRLDHDKPSKQFTITIRDKGMGQLPNKIHETLLSLGQSDKADKPYLIGVFGQGGSSAYSASEYSIIMSRRSKAIRNSEKNGDLGWSIVRSVQPKGRRDLYYAYLAADESGAVPTIDAVIADKLQFVQGTMFSHIKYDFGGSESAIARLMYQALNHVLFSPILPYELYSIKDTPEQMMGTAQRLAKQVRGSGRQSSIDKFFSSQRLI